MTYGTRRDSTAATPSLRNLPDSSRIRFSSPQRTFNGDNPGGLTPTSATTGISYFATFNVTTALAGSNTFTSTSTTPLRVCGRNRGCLLRPRRRTQRAVLARCRIVESQGGRTRVDAADVGRASVRCEVAAPHEENVNSPKRSRIVPFGQPGGSSKGRKGQSLYMSIHLFASHDNLIRASC